MKVAAPVSDIDRLSRSRIGENLLVSKITSPSFSMVIPRLVPERFVTSIVPNELEAHDICGRLNPQPMKGKPRECFLTEISLESKPGDTFIVTFPKTGTTFVQYVCHLLNTNCDTDFEDVHQVCPHLSSAWFIGQDVNANAPTSRQIGSYPCTIPRLFKSHRQLEQVLPFSKGIKYIATIRDPNTTLLSVFSFKKARFQLPADMTLEEYALSDNWSRAFSEGCIQTVFDHYATFWKCRNTKNLLLLPYEDIVSQRAKWIPVIAKFMECPCDDALIQKVSNLTSKDAMLESVSKFDESWCARERERMGRHHPNIVRDAPKVTKGNPELAKDLANNPVILKHQEDLWRTKVEAVTGVSSYEEMRRALEEKYFPASR